MKRVNIFRLRPTKEQEAIDELECELLRHK